MDAFTTLSPVFFMIILGFVAKKRQWLSLDQKRGINHLVFTILFPILIFKLLAGTKLEFGHISIVLYVSLVFLAAYILGKVISPFISKKYKHFMPYLITVVEGGNVALPLYLSIVINSSNTVIFDLAGVLFCFVIFPMMVAKQSSQVSSKKELVIKIFMNPFVITVIFSFIFNLTGAFHFIMNSSLGAAFTKIFDTVLAPVVPLILFLLGYDFEIDKEKIIPLLKLMSLKLVIGIITVLGFFVFFPQLMKDHVFMLAPIIYFSSPTGFGLLPILEPLYKDEDDASFSSAFISLFMIVTLIVYTFVVLFIA